MIVNKNKTTSFLKSLNKDFFFVAFLFLFASCVGTIDDKNPNTTKGSEAGSALVFFNGINKAEPVSDEKINVFFEPAQGSAQDLTYLVSYDGLAVPFSYPATLLRPEYNGLLKVTISGLNINSAYNFQVQVRNTLGQTSKSDKSIKVRTFSNKTARFQGIKSVKNLSGVDGRYAVRVEWTGADDSGKTLKDPRDPINYEIVLLRKLKESDSSAQTANPSQFDNKSLPNEVRKEIIVSSDKLFHQVNGLEAGTEYYVRVRCTHDEFSDNSTNPLYKREENTDYREIKTLSSNGDPLEFDQNSLTFILDQGPSGLNSFNLTWDPAKGSFDHYRIYYREFTPDNIQWPTTEVFSSYYGGFPKDQLLPICNGADPRLGKEYWYCQKEEFSASTATLTDLKPFTKYMVHLIACYEADCAPKAPNPAFDEYNSNTDPITNPGIASFSGIEEVINPKYYWALGEVYLKVTPPDLSSGVADGLLVGMQVQDDNGDLIFSSGPTAGEINDYQIINSPDVDNTTSPYQVPPFDFETTEEIVVRGVDPTSDNTYCFTVMPFTWQNGSAVAFKDSAVQECQKIVIQPPTLSQFQGFTGYQIDTNDNSVTLSWNSPTGGLYDKFVVWIRNDGTQFNYSDVNGLANPPAYYRFELPFSARTFTAPFLTPGNYQFGILTQFSGTGQYSEPYPASIQTITIDP